MATQHGLHVSFHRSSAKTRVSTRSDATTAVSAKEVSVAALRIGTGFLFLWAFFDKTFGWGYATSSKHAWIHGGSPTKGFLSSVNVGPFQSTFHNWAGTGWADWLFMLALLGVGLAMVLGVGMRLAAVAGTVLVALMWFAVFPPARHAADGTATSSTNPFVDEHVMDALALTAAAVFGTASRLGLGAWWAKLPFVRDHKSLL